MAYHDARYTIKNKRRDTIVTTACNGTIFDASNVGSACSCYRKCAYLRESVIADQYVDGVYDKVILLH